MLPTGIGGNRQDVASGRADAVSQEGARGEEWENLARTHPLTFLSMDAEVASALEREYGFGTLTAPAYYPGQDRPFVAADFSDWLICVRADMDEKLAYQLAQIVIEKRDQLDKEYGSENPRYSSVNVSLDPKKLVNTAPVPPHPGAAWYYRDHGLK